jgi:hypothetical protein
MIYVGSVKAADQALHLLPREGDARSQERKPGLR